MYLLNNIRLANYYIYYIKTCSDKLYGIYDNILGNNTKMKSFRFDKC